MKINPTSGNLGLSSANFYFSKRPDSKYSRVAGHQIRVATARCCKAAHDHRRLYINGLERPHVNQTHLSKQVVGWIWPVGHSLSSPDPDLIKGKILNTKKPHLHEAVQCKVGTLVTPLCNRKGPLHHSRGTPRNSCSVGLPSETLWPELT